MSLGLSWARAAIPISVGPKPITPARSFLQISLAFPASKSDESWCAETRKLLNRKDHKHMKSTESTDTTQTAAVAAQGAHVAPEKAASKKGATRKTGVPNRQKTAKGAKAKDAAPKKGAKAGKKAAKTERKGTAPRAESKGAKILDMIGRAKGATLAEIMKATEWQAHSVRGFISTAGKKHGVKIESTKNEAGDRLYRSSK
jgi:hypothetical protein